MPIRNTKCLRCGAAGGEARIWEWFNDMHANNRLIQVSIRLDARRFRVQPGAAPEP